MNKNEPAEDYIDLGEIFNTLVRRIGIILLAAVVFGLGGFLYAAFLATPLYNAEAMMIVNSGEHYSEYVSTDQLRSAASLVNTYSVIVTSDTVMDDVVKNLKMEDTFKDEVDKITVTAVNDTQIMRITVTASSPETALKVCSEITRVAPPVILDVVEAGSVKMVSKASVEPRPVTASAKKVTALAGAAGFLLAAAVIVIITIMDNKVKNENDIRNANLALIGVVPSYDLEGK